MKQAAVCLGRWSETSIQPFDSSVLTNGVVNVSNCKEDRHIVIYYDSSEIYYLDEYPNNVEGIRHICQIGTVQ